MSLMRPSMNDCLSRAAWYSAFSLRSPCSRATAIAWMIAGRWTLLRLMSSSRSRTAPSGVIGFFCMRLDADLAQKGLPRPGP